MKTYRYVVAVQFDAENDAGANDMAHKFIQSLQKPVTYGPFRLECQLLQAMAAPQIIERQLWGR